MPGAPLAVGAVGDGVATLQGALARQGVQLPASEVGRRFFGPATRQAVQQIQQQNGLPVTGSVDDATMTAMSAAPALVMSGAQSTAYTAPSPGSQGGPQTSNFPSAGGRTGTVPPASGGGPAGVATTAMINLQRIPASVDPLGAAAAGQSAAMLPFRVAAAARVFAGIEQIRHNIGLINVVLQQPMLPAQLIGVLHQPDGIGVARVQLQFDPKSVGSTGSMITTLTADDGSFTLAMPANAPVPTDGLKFTVHGANSNFTISLPASQIAANGVIGVLTLAQPMAPLPTSILAALGALTPKGQTPTAAATPAPPKLQVTIGEAGSLCMQSFAASDTTDRFPWGVFFRIVEPRMSIVTVTQSVPAGEGRFSWLANYATQSKGAGVNAGAQQYVDRVPVDQPLSVDGFRSQIAGVNTNGMFVADETVPMAASLGLGYVLWMAQEWDFLGLGLGDLVYSLPLAPGEQQQVAVFERRDTSSVYESEFFSESEAMTQTALSDTSTNATFNSAFNEAASGGSQFQTDSSSSSWGGNLILVSGGGGSSSASGTSSSWIQGQRDTTQQAAQTTHSSAENQAAARRTANRTGMRLASTSESMGVTTKTITNHNHTRALTMQYWEVLRMFDVTTTIDGLTLVCLVPMQIVRFMPPGQPATLNNPAWVGSRTAVLARYWNIIQHLDVLLAAVPRRFQYGLTLLAQFAADPTAVVDSSTSVAEDVITFQLQGGFLACETVSIAAVTRRNTRVGPVQLAPSVAGQPTPIREDKFASRADLIAWLTEQRQNATTLQGSLALPTSMNRADIVGFEITRQFRNVNYTLISPEMQAIGQLQTQFGATNNAWEQPALQALLGPSANVRATVTLNPNDLESAVGGPVVSFFQAAIEDLNASGQNVPLPTETYANDSLQGTVLPPQPFPVPALQIAPALRYREILEIEKSAQHIVHNTTLYSKAVWLSMTAEERAILLDGYTIGVPAGGLADASEMIPLLNCIENKVLGVFGNSLMMPFIIPQDVAEQMQIDPAALQQALLAYQQSAFAPPHSTVALPTRGVLGEAVLGHCPSAEKIDLTRFWNWQDAPSDTAPGIGMVQLPTTTPPLTTGVTAPNSLTNLPPLINNLITAPQPNTSLLQAMGQQAASQQDFSPTLTGQQQLASLMQNAQTLANQARQDALKTSQTLTSQALATVGNIVGAAYGNSTAGSSAAAAANNTAQPPVGTNANTQQATGVGGSPATGTPQTPTPGKTPAGPAAAGKGTPATPGSTPGATPGAAPAGDAAGAAGAAGGGDAAGAGAAAGAGDAAGAAGAGDLAGAAGAAALLA
jgi:hypothetical protein